MYASPRTSEGIMFSGCPSGQPAVHSCHDTFTAEANSSILISMIDLMKVPQISPPTVCITSIIILVVNMIKLKVKFKDG